MIPQPDDPGPPRRQFDGTQALIIFVLVLLLAPALGALINWIFQ